MTRPAMRDTASGEGCALEARVGPSVCRMGNENTHIEGAARTAPWISRLTVTTFRSYGAASVEAKPGVCVVSGPNGSGKTNLLEAISFLAPGRGLRGDGLGAVAQREIGEGAPPRLNASGGAGALRWAVAAEVETHAGAVRLGVGCQTSDTGAVKRLVRIDGIAQSGPAALAKHIRLVWASPAIDRLFVDAAGERRRFFDRMVTVFDPAHSRHLGRFERQARQRLKLLDTGGDERWLATLEEEMAEAAIAISAGRNAFLDRLQEAAAAWSGTVGAFPVPALHLVGQVEEALRRGSALEAEDAYRAALREGRMRDGAAGRTLEGPHRSDFQAVYRDKSMPAQDCSTGEQKAMVLGLILAQARLLSAGWGTPVILLDEVAAHFDSARREALFTELLSMGGQVWLTGADADLFSGLRGSAAFYHITDGRIVPETT
ncbi:MAG: DNA replication/repair protein RecF [Pseudomonadota bacterium]